MVLDFCMLSSRLRTYRLNHMVTYYCQHIFDNTCSGLMLLFQELELDKFVTHEMKFEEINSAFDLLMKGKCLRCVIWMGE